MDKITQKLIEIETKLDMILMMVKARNEKSNSNTSPDDMEYMNKKIVIVGAGVAGINAATKLVDNGYPGELITIIDKGNDPHEIAKAWYQYLLDKGVKFEWNTEVTSIHFEESILHYLGYNKKIVPNAHSSQGMIKYDTLIFAVGKSGIDFAQKLADEYQLPNL